MNDKTLFKNQWVKIIERDGWYTFGQLDGDGVSILPYRWNDPVASLGCQVLARHEYTPCHEGGIRLTAITETKKEGEGPISAAIRALREEGGIEIKSTELSRIVCAGWVYPSKFLDYKQHLYAIDVTGKKCGELHPDGTLGEKDAYVKWMDLPKYLCEINDPGPTTIVCKLMLKGIRLI